MLIQSQPPGTLNELKNGANRVRQRAFTGSHERTQAGIPGRTNDRGLFILLSTAITYKLRIHAARAASWAGVMAGSGAKW